MIGVDLPPVGSTVETVLADGSVCLVERRAAGRSMISRFVDGVCVWGQAFSSYVEDHPGQVARVVAGMAESPAGYRRWYL